MEGYCNLTLISKQKYCYKFASLILVSICGIEMNENLLYCLSTSVSKDVVIQFLKLLKKLCASLR